MCSTTGRTTTVATTAREMNTLCDRLDTLVDRLDQERLTDLPRERTDAKGDKALLDALDRRAKDLATALTVHGDAKEAFMAAKAAYKVDPTATDTNYAKAFGLAATLESILDYRTKRSDKSKTDTKVDETKVIDKDAKEGEDKAKSKGKPVADDKSKTDPKADSTTEKTDGKAKDDKSETDKVLAAIAKLGEDCAKQHDELGKRIDALEPRLIKSELAKIINSRTPEQLAAALEGQGVTPQQAAFLEALVARFTPDEFLALLDIRDAGLLDRFRFAFGGNGTTPTPTRGGSHR